MNRKQEEMFSLTCWEENPNGENPRNQVGTENPNQMQGSGPRWDLNLGPVKR